MGKKLLIENGTSLNEYLSQNKISPLVKSELIKALASNGIYLVIVDLGNKSRHEHSTRGKLYILGEDIVKDMIEAVEGTLRVH